MTEKQITTLKDRLSKFKEGIEEVQAVISDFEICESDVSKGVLFETAKKMFQDVVSQRVFAEE